jgi:hypothetical protein
VTQIALLTFGLVGCVTLSPVIDIMYFRKYLPACAGPSFYCSVRVRMIISPLKKEAAYSSEISVNFENTKRCFISAGSLLNSHRPENLQSNIHISVSFSCFTSAQFGPRPSHCWVFEITRRLTICGRTPLDEGSARHTDLYLTTHKIHKRLTSMPPPPDGIRTRSPNSRAAANVRLSSRGYGIST